jgi:hypothetical protein
MSSERYSPITISASLFRHGPEMFKAMNEQNVRWPRFTPSEMKDLVGFLNSRLVPYVAAAEK